MLYVEIITSVAVADHLRSLVALVNRVMEVSSIYHTKKIGIRKSEIIALCSYVRPQLELMAPLLDGNGGGAKDEDGLLDCCRSSNADQTLTGATRQGNDSWW